MKITIKTKDYKPSKNIEDYVNEKIGSLEKYANVFQDEKKYYNGYFGKGKPKAEAVVELSRTTEHHQKGKVFRAEVQIWLPGKDIRAVSISDNMKTSITEVKDELQRQLKKYEGKASAKSRRAARAIKKLFHLSPLARFRKNK